MAFNRPLDSTDVKFLMDMAESLDMLASQSKEDAEIQAHQSNSRKCMSIALRIHTLINETEIPR